MPEYTTSQIAKMIDHSILHPTFTDIDLAQQCAIALQYNTATVCVKPYHTIEACQILKDGPVKVCSVIGFPHGNNTIAIKAAETRQVLNDGAREVDMVINIGKALQHDWKYIEQEIKTVNDLCLNSGALLKVIFETDYIRDDASKIRLCQICSDCKVAFVKTSTGYGFVKKPNGLYTYNGATDHDLKLMRMNCSPQIQIKAAGGIRTLDDVLRVKDLGVSRVGATATQAIMEDAKKRFPDI
jgi:deoxyribose-phosphate aldolase